MKFKSCGNTVRRATAEDLPAIRRIYNQAKAYMVSNGNPTQWPEGYPYDDILAEDIEIGQIFVVCKEDDAPPHGVFALIAGIDPTYINIYDGCWLNDRDYITLHRVGSDGTLSGIMRTAVTFARAKYPELDVRIDTHADNAKMHEILNSLGFKKCGTIFVLVDSPRTAYQLVTG